MNSDAKSDPEEENRGRCLSLMTDWEASVYCTPNSTEYCPENVGFPLCVHTERAL